MKETFIVLFALILEGLGFYLLWWGKGRFELVEPWEKIVTGVLVILTIAVIIGTVTGSIQPFPFLERLW